MWESFKIYKFDLLCKNINAILIKGLCEISVFTLTKIEAETYH